MTEERIPVVILGAGGYASVVWEILDLRPEIEVIGCTDKALGLSERSMGEGISLRILGDDDVLSDLAEQHPGLRAVLALGPGLMDVRTRLIRTLSLTGIPSLVAVHPRAIVSRMAKLEEGTVVGAGAVLGPFTALGRHCVAYMGATIDHDAKIGNNVFIGQDACVSNDVEVHDDVVIEMGASINSRVTVGQGARITGGAFVNTDVPDGAVVVGMPARVVRYQK
jgi:sugar O-acyltransferase (sialic acid O-acetyltransferase NeuD family)